MYGSEDMTLKGVTNHEGLSLFRGASVRHCMGGISIITIDLDAALQDIITPDRFWHAENVLKDITNFVAGLRTITTS